jgi:ABC-type transport system involved in cytochrome c biogenesis permease subunit
LNDGIKKLLKPLASLTLTVVLLMLSMLLVYSGTVIQKQAGIQDVQREFFHSWYAWMPIDPFLRPFAEAGKTVIPGSFPLVGGYTLIVLLLANLFAAHSVRFKLNWKRSGIIAIHLGLIVLLMGEVFTSLFAVESQMMIDEGQTVNYSFDLRHNELAIIDSSDKDHDQVTVVNESQLKPGLALQLPSIPFQVVVDNYYPNTGLLGPMQEATPDAVQLATAGANQKLKIIPRPKVAGTEGSQTDVASAFVTLRQGEKSLGTYLVTQWEDQQPGLVKPQTVTVDGKTYRLSLRYRRYYKPYTITLLKFSFDRYPGTEVAKNFSSRIRLVDPTRHVDREVKIWMNHPLTYPALVGETFFQQSFLPTEKTTILQVTQNPAWMMPYIGLALGLLGMVVHFGIQLIGFLRRRAKAERTPVTSKTGSSYTLEPKRPSVSWAMAIVGGLVCLVTFVGVLTHTAPSENGFDLETFGKLPVSYGGRVMPLDTLAEIGLKVSSGKMSVTDPADKEKSLSAIRWLADTITDSPASQSYKIFRIDDPSVLTQLGLDANEKYFSLDDLLKVREMVQKQWQLGRDVAEKQRDGTQKHFMELAEHIETYLRLRQPGRLMLVPPVTDSQEAWKTLESDSGLLNVGAEPMVQLIQSYHDGKATEFNTAVVKYHADLKQKMPGVMGDVDFETLFNRADPFFWSMWLYVIVFAVACISWLGFQRQMWSLAMGMLAVIVLYHTFGLAARVYLTGWGPVTTLYSSAVFIGWAVVLLAIGLELVYRNGIGAAVAAMVGFMTLVVAYFLGLDGDTMKPIVAVLMTKFWLWTHVPSVTLGYAATLLSGALAVAWVPLSIATPMIDEERSKAMSRMVYAITCFAMLFSFVGTILGGIWADYSWGRFWGWDPKENGAILIVLWNAVILHARWGGLVRQRGMMVLAILGIVVTTWSWFGTNLLGIGLHSYGFMEGAATWLKITWAVTVGFALLAMTPMKWWWSERAKTA